MTNIIGSCLGISSAVEGSHDGLAETGNLFSTEEDNAVKIIFISGRVMIVTKRVVGLLAFIIFVSKGRIMEILKFK